MKILNKLITTTALILTLCAFSSTSFALDDVNYNIKHIYLNQDQTEACEIMKKVATRSFSQSEQSCGNLFNKLTFENHKLRSMYFTVDTFGFDATMSVRDFAQIVVDNLKFVDSLEVDYDYDEKYIYINSEDRVKVEIFSNSIMPLIRVSKFGPAKDEQIF